MTMVETSMTLFSSITGLRAVHLSLLGLAGTAALASTTAFAAASDPFPTHPVVIKVAYPAGGGADVATRQLTQRLSQALGQTVVIENLGGAGGSVATLAFLRQPADGYQLLSLTGNDAVMNPMTSAAAKYKPENLRLVHPLIISDFALVSARDDAPASLDALIARMKAPGAPEYSFGNWGVGSTPHLAAEDFRRQAGVKTLDVPYRGVSPIVQDLLGKGLDFAFLPVISSVLDLIRAGKLKVVGMGTAARNQQLPDVPSAGDSKILKNFDYKVWPGVFVHSTTPEPIVAKLHTAISAVVNSPEYQKWSVDSGNNPMTPMSLAQAEAFYRDELARGRRLAAAMNLQPQ
jgi:tripartite-type tricarboxylate transporter receptor subunit TctC